MSEWLSNKFKWLSFVATWVVVCIHARTDRWAPNANDWANNLQAFIAPAFQFAVPLFFTISGFMFVRSYDKYTFMGGGLISRKIRSLYIPAVLWFWLTILLCLPIRFYTGELPAFLNALCAPPLLWIEGGVGTSGAQFWYVRSLLFMFLLAPLMRFLSRKWFVALLVILIFSLSPFQPTYKRGGYNFLQAIDVVVGFFLLGAAASSNKRFVNWINQNSRFGILLSLIGLGFTFLPNANATRFGQILFLWGLYDVIDRYWAIPKLPRFLDCHFFVYCCHLIALCWGSGALQILIGKSAVSRTIGYFALWMTFWLDIVLANLVARYFPRVYAVLSGGRV